MFKMLSFFFRLILNLYVIVCELDIITITFPFLFYFIMEVGGGVN